MLAFVAAQVEHLENQTPDFIVLNIFSTLNLKPRYLKHFKKFKYFISFS